MRILIIENSKGTHFGQMGVALAEAGAQTDLRRPWNGDALPATPADFDGMVVFGGEQSALDDHTHPYLPALAKLMRDFGKSDLPVLGICLGSQVLARAYGAENILGTAPEFGWCEVALNEDAGNDPLFSGLDTQFPIFEWHSDTFTLPAGAVRLASSSAVANQAFRIGRASYGTQFHFEASRKVVGAWNEEFPAVISGKDPQWFENYAETAKRYGPTADAVGLEIARSWVRLVKSGVAEAQYADASEIS